MMSYTLTLFKNDMVKKQNPLIKLRTSKSNIRFEELVKTLLSLGYREQNVIGSHHIFGKSGCLQLLIVKPLGNKKTCHPRDVNKVIKVLEAIEPKSR